MPASQMETLWGWDVYLSLSCVCKCSRECGNYLWTLMVILGRLEGSQGGSRRGTRKGEEMDEYVMILSFTTFSYSSPFLHLILLQFSHILASSSPVYHTFVVDRIYSWRPPCAVHRYNNNTENYGRFVWPSDMAVSFPPIPVSPSRPVSLNSVSSSHPVFYLFLYSCLDCSFPFIVFLILSSYIFTPTTVTKK